MTSRPTDSTGEFEDFSDEVEELCISELKKCLRVPEEQAPLKRLNVQENLTYNEHPVKNFWRPLRELLGTRRQRCAECNGVTIPRRWAEEDLS